MTAATITAYQIERHDGSTDGMGDEILFRTEEAARAAAQTAFGDDPASRDGGIGAWLQIVPIECESSDPRLAD